MHSKMAVITFFEQGEGPGIDNSLPGGGYPSQGLPGISGPVDPGYGRPSWGGHPGNALPPPGSIATLPVFPFDPTLPDNSLPGPQPTPTPPIQIRPGAKFVVKWLACHGLILVPDNALPSTPEPKK